MAGAWLFLPLVLGRALLGVGLLPWYVMTTSPDAPLARLTALLLTKFGLIGYLGFYAVPPMALCAWSSWVVIGLKRKPNPRPRHKKAGANLPPPGWVPQVALVAAGNEAALLACAYL